MALAGVMCWLARDDLDVVVSGAQRVENHPLIQPYAGSTLTRRDEEGFSDYKAVVGLDQQGKTDDEVIRTVAVSGRLTRLSYENAKGRSPVEILSKSDKATIIAASKPALDVIGRFLTENAGLAVYIVGHTDSDGTFDYNLNLSRQRVQAVVDRLVTEYRVAPTRLAAHGVGPLSPTRTNATGPGKAANRRVEMVAR